jgi:hypothetical protein
MKNSYRFLYFVAIILSAVFLFNCSSKKGGEKNNSFLPIARGADGVILVVMDTALWSDTLGAEIKKTFGDYIPGLPQDEPYFTLRVINPLKLNDILKAAKNMIFVTTLDKKGRQSNAMRNFMTDESLKKIQRDTSLYRYTNRDAYARGQEILHLFGKDQNQLIAHIRANREQLRNYFLSIEKSRIAKSIFAKEEKAMAKVLKKDHGFSMRIPYGYDLAQNKKDFVWIRFLDPEYEKNIFVHHAPYTSQEPFQSPVDYRESITTKYIRDIEKPDLYMTLQKVPHTVKEINFNGKYAKETRGLWMFSDISGGGAFLSYVFVDESQKRVYYVEGYAYAPSQDKREFMRELEVILSTFKSGAELE